MMTPSVCFGAAAVVAGVTAVWAWRANDDRGPAALFAALAVVAVLLLLTVR